MIRLSPHLSLLPALLLSPLLLFPLTARADAPLLRDFSAVSLSPDGHVLAALEGNESAVPGRRVIRHLVLRAVSGGRAVTVATPDCPECDATSPAWSRDGTHVAFVLRKHGDSLRRIMQVDAFGGALTTLLSFDGAVQDLRFGPDGTLAVLAIAGARRDPGALEAGAPQTGEIDAQVDEQRIALVRNGRLDWQSPADLYVYEYDWRPGGVVPRFVGTAAHGNGDENWWRARLYGFANGAATELYAPPLDKQLGEPRVAPDGRSVAFIGGLMSDFGFFGGDVFSLDLEAPGATPRDLTRGLPATVTGLSWCGSDLVGAGIAGARTAFWTVGRGAPKLLDAEDDLLSTGGGEPNFSCAGARMAAVRQSFTRAPALVVGAPGAWTVLTHDNDAMPANAVARSVAWRSDGFDVQGWLLSPVTRKPGVERNGKVPMIVDIHGGPSSAVTPRYLRARSFNKSVLDAGYDLFLPNPRGSYGQGEAFTHANRRDFGHGDLRDILRGVDAVEKIAPVDDSRLGVTGYSYGGFMTMWAVTQTDRFKAAVAGGGIANWQSYYGQNGIDGWMPPFFGATVYDDPAAYAKSSPIVFIKHVRTPTFIYVGANDEECPPAQSLEFYHALRTLGVPTRLVIYPGEGHGIRNPQHAEDAAARSVAWFNQYLSP
ncbi:alpha/beta hydrolase family protein [Acidomonas methanolica]|uniref:Peptidase S9C n=1 Tax=Acidomonas methanolica NBRC 104435 TaxID=1231351 RepID=A0A023D214_ACIMT|nr:S9 family peptidase [Acidomonas methanolica]MBU2654960.1 S9 family peptidase [Acidomonas methanolica]TCS26311.1 dipeptidyl aminopeptidase/acylaminoacyl peptidase [Acidomonas methanolica]GAJ27805.1 peptidase S9C [Acidomonas methanolica NBRC 104435]GBQ50809.1 putative peptidase [Acidomonas methanolica]GEK99158.1 acyl-peptide hydrolase [Acidomonas methanolica NBRC 104435]